MELGEIEFAFVQYSNSTIRTACVTVHRISEIDHLVAYVIVAENDTGPEESGFDSGVETILQDVKAELKKASPAYMVPNYIQVHHGSFPTLPSGKLDRKKLPIPSGENTYMPRGLHYYKM